MKSRLTLIALLLLLQLTAQTNISSTDWQEDLKFLQHTVHKDYPFLFKKTNPKEFDIAIQNFHRAIPKMQAHEVLVGFAKIVGMFKYGHTRVGFREGPVP